MVAEGGAARAAPAAATRRPHPPPRRSSSRSRPSSLRRSAGARACRRSGRGSRATRARVEGRAAPETVAAVGRLDLDHVRAARREQLRAVRPGDMGCQVETAGPGAGLRSSACCISRSGSALGRAPRHRLAGVGLHLHVDRRELGLGIRRGSETSETVPSRTVTSPVSAGARYWIFEWVISARSPAQLAT